MFKIVYTSDGEVYGEYENYEDYRAAMEELAESLPFDLDDCGRYESYEDYCAAMEEMAESLPYGIDDCEGICYIDDGDPF